jgi:rhodanese-related sulfurtransferase
MVKEIYNNKLILYLVIVFFVIAFIYFSYQYAVSSKYIVSSEMAKKMIMDKKIDLVLDVRTDVERNTLGYYPGSVHIQSADLEKKMISEYPNKDLYIISYCNTGHRARMATDKLHELGYKNAMYISSTYTSIM